MRAVEDKTKGDKSNPMPVIEIRDLLKDFNEKTVLQGVSLIVNQGDIYGFLGPNGSGKTTTLRILLGILKPDAGEVSLLGLDPTTHGAQLRHRVNALPESHGLYGWMSAIDYLHFFGRLYGMDLSLDEYRTRLKQVGLDPFDRRPTRTYSRGMKQRLGIARAMINNPAMLLLDEPTNGLDPRGRREIHDLLRQLNREKGLTIMISTHILDDGRVRYEGQPVYESSAAVRYRFHLENGASILAHWDFPGIVLLEHKDDWITCLIKGISPTQAIKTLVIGGVSISEAVMVSDGLEELYLQYTSGGDH
jgi:ABC-2 type transport system ATP-binding protein